MPEMSVNPGALDERHLEAAADWFLLLAEQDDPDLRRRWRHWHDAADAHQQAWQKVEKLQSLLSSAPRQAAQILRQPGRSAARNASRTASQDTGRKSRRQLLTLAGAIFVSGAAWKLLRTGDDAPQTQWVATAQGERRAVALPDGGQVWLGPQSRLGIAYSDHGRDLYLTQGAMQLATARDPQGRALRILVRDGVVRPLGTRLTVSQYPEHTVLAVQEHAAEVQALVGAPVRLSAGQRISFARNGCGRVQLARVADDAWTRGLLMAMETPLVEFAAQFALYSGQQVEVAPALSGRRVSGAYHIDAPAKSLQTLAEVLAVRLDKTADGWRFRPRA